MNISDAPKTAQITDVKSMIYAWIHIGSDGYSKRQTQRIVLTNVMISVTAILSYMHAIIFAFYDFDQLKWPIAILLTIGTALLVTPYLNKKNPYLGSIYNLSLWLGYGCAITVIFGTKSGVYFYFLAGAASAFLIMGVYQNALSVLSFSLQIGLFIFFDQNAFPTASFIHVDQAFIYTLHIATILLSMVFIFCMIYYAFYQAHLAEDALEREYDYSEKLLANMLPRSIASALKRNPGKTIADSHDDVTILFADIVDFSQRAETQNATELVSLLNEQFTCFDLLAKKHGLEKIKTIGDAFMVAGGLPEPQPDHAERVAYMALDMMEEIHRYSQETGDNLELRIGIHTGSVVAGVIGTQKPLYDVWGDTVNIASRLESTGTVGGIQVTNCTKRLLDKTFKFKNRGKIKIKGKGELNIWYLINAL